MSKKKFDIKKIKDLDASTENNIEGSEVDSELLKELNPDIEITADEAENINASTKNTIRNSKVKSKWVWIVGGLAAAFAPVIPSLMSEKVEVPTEQEIVVDPLEEAIKDKEVKEDIEQIFDDSLNVEE